MIPYYWDYVDSVLYIVVLQISRLRSTLVGQNQEGQNQEVDRLEGVH